MINILSLDYQSILNGSIINVVMNVELNDNEL